MDPRSPLDWMPTDENNTLVLEFLRTQPEIVEWTPPTTTMSQWSTAHLRRYGFPSFTLLLNLAIVNVFLDSAGRDFLDHIARRPVQRIFILVTFLERFTLSDVSRIGKRLGPAAVTLTHLSIRTEGEYFYRGTSPTRDKYWTLMEIGDTLANELPGLKVLSLCSIASENFVSLTSLL